MPLHNHGISAADGDSTTKNPSNNVSAFTAAPAYTNNANVAMQPTGQSGGNQPHDNMQPYLGITFAIALQGIFPSRN
jgi:microcystin-dependent protein